ncbi:MAG: enterochelin esterase [Planctomycetota bacterium]|nr:MAG: enterochelin esterase [Planctomycetota bacterium]
MSALLEQLSHQGRLDAGRLEGFFQEHEFPLVEGQQVTFVYQGQAEAVNVRHWIHGLPSSQALRRWPGSHLWTLTMEIPEGSRVEYKLEIVQHGQRRWIQDPLNEKLAADPFGANSVVYGEGYQTPDWVQPQEDARQGKLVDHHLDSKIFHDRREFQIYLPARFRRTRRYPLVIVHDGHDYLKYANLKIVLDNLIHRLEIPPLIAAVTSSAARMREYAGIAEHGNYLVEELLPFVEDHYPLLQEPSDRCLMGASFGAIASLATAWRHPGVFGKLLLQSGSFAFTDIGEHDAGPAFDPVVEFMNSFRREPGKPADKMFMSCGTYEGLIYYNRSMAPFFQRTGMEVRFTEARDGHNWENWRDRLQEGLSWLFPGPLWMIYE